MYHSREGTTETAVERVVSEQDGIVTGIRRLASRTRDLGLVIVHAAKLGAITVEAIHSTDWSAKKYG